MPQCPNEKSDQDRAANKRRFLAGKSCVTRCFRGTKNDSNKPLGLNSSLTDYLSVCQITHDALVTELGDMRDCIGMEAGGAFPPPQLKTCGHPHEKRGTKASGDAEPRGATLAAQ